MTDDITTESAPQFPKDAKPWLNMLAEAERRDKSYHAACDNIDKVYACIGKASDQGKDPELQVFWANMQVLMPTIYSRAPVPIVSPRFRDRKELPRKAGELVERSLITDVELDRVHDKLKRARDDLARNARGVLWVVADRNPWRARSKWVPRKKFRHGKADHWQAVPWVAKAEDLTKERYKKRFKSVQEGVEFKARDGDGDAEDEFTTEQTARVWEIWHKDKAKVIWVAEGAKEIADAQDPWIEIDDFWPCPEPAYGTLRPETLTPIPDYVYYQDQLREINDLTDRISRLADALQVRCFYAKGSGDIGSAIELALGITDNNQIAIPVENFAALGGAKLQDALAWMPIDVIATTLVSCVELRKNVIQDVYEITGLSDIMRGATEAQETLGAQQLKAQFGSVRVKERQMEMQRLARDVFRIKAEIMAENYDPQQLLDLSQIDDLPTDQDVAQKFEQAKAQIIQQAEQALQQMAQQALQQQAQPQPQQGMPQ